MRVPLVACCLAAGCASANVGITGDDVGVDAPHGVDAPDPVDGPPIDSATVTQTISETTTNNNTASNSVTCPTGEQSWYRVFRPSAFGIQGAFNITQVTFGAQEASASPNVVVKVSAYTGTLGAATVDLSKVGVLLGNGNITLPNLADPGNNQVVPLTATVPSGTDFIVELNIASNDAVTPGTFFFVGASNAGETQPGYLRAPSCVGSDGVTPISTPTSTTALGAATANLNITVTGTHN